MTTVLQQVPRRPPPAEPGSERADVLGCKVDRLDMPQTLDRVEALIAERGFAQHVAINAAKIVAMRKDAQLRDIVDHCELVTADGQSVVWASRVLGDPVPERVTGIDLMARLLELAADRGLQVFLLGSRTDVLARATARIREQYPGLRLVGAHDGYFSDEAAADVAAEVRAAHPDILFVAMSSPKKEYWLARFGRDLGVPFVMGVGGALDVVAGVTRRAPKAVQRLGLEWAWRLAQEPGRLWRRYLVSNTEFVLLLVRSLVMRRVLRPALRRSVATGR